MNSLKEYTITVYYSANITVKVVADSDDDAVSEAIEKASDIPMTEADVIYNDYQIEKKEPLSEADLLGI